MFPAGRGGHFLTARDFLRCASFGLVDVVCVSGQGSFQSTRVTPHEIDLFLDNHSISHTEVLMMNDDDDPHNTS